MTTFGPTYELSEAVRDKALRSSITGDGIPDGIYISAASKYANLGDVVIYIANEQVWTRQWRSWRFRQLVIEDAHVAWKQLKEQTQPA